MVDLNKLIAAQRELNQVRAKVEMLDAYNMGPRFGQLWINGDAIELTRDDYNDIVVVLREKFLRKIEQIESETLSDFVS